MTHYITRSSMEALAKAVRSRRIDEITGWRRVHVRSDIGRFDSRGCFRRFRVG